jgi:phosphonate transport system permease protein
MTDTRATSALLDIELRHDRGRERGHPEASPGQARGPGRTARRGWAIVVGLAVVWSLWSAGVGPGSFNSRGWPLVWDFAAAAVAPDLSGRFLAVVIDATVVTVAYAIVGTALSVVLGAIAGVLTSETWWRRDPQHRRAGSIGPGWWIVRTTAALPRGIHEAVWALFLLQVLGLDPMVAVLAIGIPFGAIMAKVVAEFIDDAAQEPYDALRAAGAGRLSAMTGGAGRSSGPARAAPASAPASPAVRGMANSTVNISIGKPMAW